MVREVRPHQCTLVPVRPGEVTSQAGWPPDTPRGGAAARSVADLQAHGIRVSLFVDPEPAAVEVGGVDGRRRGSSSTPSRSRTRSRKARTRRTASFRRYVEAANLAHALGLGINAGHDLDLDNLVLFRTLPHLDEVSIGHALISHALYVGLDRAVRDYLRACDDWRYDRRSFTVSKDSLVMGVAGRVFRRPGRLDHRQPAGPGAGRAGAGCLPRRSQAGVAARPAPPPLDESRASAMKTTAQQNPADAVTRVQLGNMYFDAGRFQEAAEWYEAALKVHPKDVNASTDLGIAYYYMNQPDKALRSSIGRWRSSRSTRRRCSNIGIVRAFGKQDLKGATEAWQRVLAVGARHRRGARGATGARGRQVRASGHRQEMMLGWILKLVLIWLVVRGLMRLARGIADGLRGTPSEPPRPSPWSAIPSAAPSSLPPRLRRSAPAPRRGSSAPRTAAASTR